MGRYQCLAVQSAGRQKPCSPRSHAKWMSLLRCESQATWGPIGEHGGQLEVFLPSDLLSREDPHGVKCLRWAAIRTFWRSTAESRAIVRRGVISPCTSDIETYEITTLRWSQILEWNVIACQRHFFKEEFALCDPRNNRTLINSSERSSF